MSEGIIAIPSKGRLKDECLALLARAGFAIAAPAERSYETTIPALPGVRVLLISAGEIAERIVRGDFHLGVTGMDVLRERQGVLAGVHRNIVEMVGEDGPVAVCPLGFGPARLVTAVPESWLDCAAMDDLREIADEIRARQHRPLRVATKYVRLTRAFFAQHLIADYRIVLSTGATEAAPASGLADMIVDITTSGATLKDNALKVLEDGKIFASEATLVLGPPGPLWQDMPGGIAQLTRAIAAAVHREGNAAGALAMVSGRVAA